MNKRDLLISIVLVETISILLGLILPISPSKTGAKNNLAEQFLDNPTYLQEFVFYYLLTNVLIILILVIFVIWEKTQKDKL